MLVRPTVVLVYTVLLNGSPVYEWRLFTLGRIELEKFTDKLTFPGFMSGGIKALLLNSGLLHFTLGITHQFGVWSPASTDELGLHFSVVPCEFRFLHWGAAVSLHSESTRCHRRYNHTLQASCSLIAKVILYIRLISRIMESMEECLREYDQGLRKMH